MKKIILFIYKYFNNLWYVEDEYGHTESIIERTIFRFWFYPSYWYYLLNKYFRIFEVKEDSNHQNQNNFTHYLTCIIPHHPGIGHQLACWNTALIFSLKYNLKFVHYPLSLKWENFLGFGDGELNYFEVANNQSIKVVNLPRIRRIDEKDNLGHDTLTGIINSERCHSKNILFQLDINHFAYDQTSTAEIIRNKYWKAREKNPIDIYLRKDRLNIACHIRRGDILNINDKSEEFKNRWLGNEYFIKIIQKIKSVLTNRDIDIHLFSQGDIADFSDFKKLGNVLYHLDEDVHQTFHGMVISDILILSPSSFSYKAGMISKAIKIAKYPWWHEIPENYEWLRSNEEGDFNVYPIIDRYSKSSH